MINTRLSDGQVKLKSILVTTNFIIRKLLSNLFDHKLFYDPFVPYIVFYDLKVYKFLC